MELARLGRIHNSGGNACIGSLAEATTPQCKKGMVCGICSFRCASPGAGGPTPPNTIADFWVPSRVGPPHRDSLCEADAPLPDDSMFGGVLNSAAVRDAHLQLRAAPKWRRADVSNPECPRPTSFERVQSRGRRQEPASTDNPSRRKVRKAKRRLREHGPNAAENQLRYVPCDSQARSADGCREQLRDEETDADATKREYAVRLEGHEGEHGQTQQHGQCAVDKGEKSDAIDVGNPTGGQL
eukprot:CAMPEP_0170438342 /NCGR_PEP_ID=MMETSP0117_2-20130122/45182_1 /TAXON_ID=400756 /ORGANISM="Durinskia baltica, Strain CSIRO CS-38" /LENGTH=240 /DNA_ID=CAMNT_0010698555 /DNA_START=40 /DNA_END=759 /DNA_ORIENTATION=+